MSDDNENAFPRICSTNGQFADDPVTSVYSEGGLTKRELFAAMSMQAIRSLGVRYTANDAMTLPHATVDMLWSSKDVAALAAADADALIAELNI